MRRDDRGAGQLGRLDAPVAPFVGIEPRIVCAHDVIGDAEHVEASGTVDVASPRLVGHKIVSEQGKTREDRDAAGSEGSAARLARMSISGDTAARVSSAEIAAAVAAEAPFMEDVLARLIEAPTTLGNEEQGQEVMRSAFRELGSSRWTCRST